MSTEYEKFSNGGPEIPTERASRIIFNDIKSLLMTRGVDSDSEIYTHFASMSCDDKFKERIAQTAIPCPNFIELYYSDEYILDMIRVPPTIELKTIYNNDPLLGQGALTTVSYVIEQYDNPETYTAYMFVNDDATNENDQHPDKGHELTDIDLTLFWHVYDTLNERGL